MEANLFIKHFSIIKDPRIERTKQYLLVDIIALTICAVISGSEGWEDIEIYGNEKEAWLKIFLELPNGIPSHDTISRLFSRLNPTEFQTGFLGWVKDISK